jgi:integrase/recombinase XerD
MREYLAGLKRRRYSSKSIDIYGRAIDDFSGFIESDGPVELPDITRQQIEAYRLHILERGFRPASVGVYLRGIRNFFRWLRERQLLFVDPTEGMRAHREPRFLCHVPTEEDVRRLLASPDTTTLLGLRNRAYMELLYATGVRREESLRLEITDIDRENATVRVMGKGNRERVVPLGSSASILLDRYLAEARPRMQKGLDSDALWIGKDGNPLGYPAVAGILRRTSIRAGLKPFISAHALRRACATHMLRRGAHPVQIQMLLGHASMRHLSQYLHLTITELHEAHAKSRPGR